MTLFATFAIGFVQAAKLDTDASGAADIGAWVAPLRFASVALIFTCRPRVRDHRPGASFQATASASSQKGAELTAS